MSDEIRSWDQLTELEQLQCIYSDAHKDAYGFRPRGCSDDLWNSVEKLRAVIQQCSDHIERQQEFEKEAEARAIASFEEMVEATIKNGAKDRETALRWIADANDYNGDWDYLCYTFGLPYGYFNKKEN